MDPNRPKLIVASPISSLQFLAVFKMLMSVFWYKCTKDPVAQWIRRWSDPSMEALWATLVEANQSFQVRVLAGSHVYVHVAYLPNRFR